MTRIIVASLVSAVVYFVWEMMTWMMIPIHGPTVAALPNEDAVRDALISQNLKSGVYIVPWGNEEDMTNPESQFMVRHKEGPLFTVFYHKDGEVPMAPSMMLGGFLLDILGALVAVGMLSFVSDAKRLATYGARVGFVTALGGFSVPDGPCCVLQLDALCSVFHRDVCCRRFGWLVSCGADRRGHHTPTCFPIPPLVS